MTGFLRVLPLRCCLFSGFQDAELFCVTTQSCAAYIGTRTVTVVLTISCSSPAIRMWLWQTSSTPCHHQQSPACSASSSSLQCFRQATRADLFQWYKVISIKGTVALLDPSRQSIGPLRALKCEADTLWDPSHLARVQSFSVQVGHWSNVWSNVAVDESHRKGRVHRCFGQR